MQNKTLFILSLGLSLAIGSYAQSVRETAPIIRIGCKGPSPIWMISFNQKTFLLDSSQVNGKNIINEKYIDRVEVLNQDKAKTLYGNRAQRGVVIIYIKKEFARKEYKRMKPYLS